MRLDQRILTQALQTEFPDAPVKSEWCALSGEGALYSPRVDIAVGPFATETQHIQFYDELGRAHHDLLTRLHEYFAKNVSSFEAQDAVPDLDNMCQRNPNARCFLAIEIEGSGSRKHIMGGAINAAALGRLGLSLACSDGQLRTLLRARRYMLFLASVGKNTFDPRNLLVLT